jgi:hypothetical protein
VIRPLRRVHCVVATALAVLLPALLALAVAGRVAAPVQQPWTIGDRP